MDIETTLDQIDALLSTLADAGHVEEAWYIRGAIDANFGQPQAYPFADANYRAGYQAGTVWTDEGIDPVDFMRKAKRQR